MDETERQGPTPPTVLVVYSGARCPGGAEAYLEGLFRGYDRSRLRLLLVSLGEWDLTERLRAMGEHVVALEASRVAPRAPAAIAELARSEGADLIASQGVLANFYARVASLLCGLPHLVTVHSDLGFDYPGAGRRLAFSLVERMLAGRTVHYLVPSDYLRRRLLSRGVPAERISVVYHGIEPQRTVAAGSISPGAEGSQDEGATAPERPPVVGSIGRLHHTKGFDLLIKAMPLISHPPSVELIIWGEGEERASLEKLIEELGLGDRARLPGYAPQVNRAFADMDIFVQPSRAEGFGLTVVEAMSAGLPVVVSQAGSLPELVADAKSGVVARGDRPVDLARELESLLADPERRERLGAEAARQARRRFTVDRWLDETTTVYEQSARATARGTTR